MNKAPPMLTEDINDSAFTIQSYNDHEIVINNTPYHNSLILTPNQLTPNWAPNSIKSIQPADLLALTESAPEIILLGTGAKSVILPPDILAPLLEKNYSVECMSTAAACRTYAVLSAEGRSVAAGLIIETNE